MKINIRLYKDADRNFVHNSFIRSIIKEKRLADDIIIKNAIENYKTVIACTDDEDQILGWAIANDDTLFYVYVKKLFRRIGIAKRLIKHLEVDKIEETETKKTDVIRRAVENG